MKTFNEIKRELKKIGIEVVKQNAYYGVGRAYKVVGAWEVNPHAIWDAEEIKNHYHNVGFFKDE